MHSKALLVIESSFYVFDWMINIEKLNLCSKQILKASDKHSQKFCSLWGSDEDFSNRPEKACCVVDVYTLSLPCGIWLMDWIIFSSACRKCKHPPVWEIVPVESILVCFQASHMRSSNYMPTQLTVEKITLNEIILLIRNAFVILPRKR